MPVPADRLHDPPRPAGGARRARRARPACAARQPPALPHDPRVL